MLSSRPYHWLVGGVGRRGLLHQCALFDARKRAALLALLRCFGRLEMGDQRQIEGARERFAVMGSGAWFWRAEQRLELDRGSVAVMHKGELVAD